VYSGSFNNFTVEVSARFLENTVSSSTLCSGKMNLIFFKKYTGCPRTHGSNLEYVFLDGNEGKKCIKKYSGCNSF
jgi:hypothetical protein